MTDFTNNLNPSNELMSGSDSSTVKSGRRKPVKISKEMVSASSSIESLRIEDLVLELNSRKLHFKRLKYKGCPFLTTQGELNPKLKHQDMKRDEFVRQMYRLFKPNFNRTWRHYFYYLCKYIRWIDSKELTAIENDYFHNDLTAQYMDQWGLWIKNGLYKKGAWAFAKGCLSAILKELGRHCDAKRLPSVKHSGKDSESHKGVHVESELKPTAKTMFRGFYGLAKHLENGTQPVIHPMFDETLFNEQVLITKWNNKTKGAKSSAFKHAVASRYNWHNQLTRLACMLCYMFTGMNSHTLLKMQRRDVKIKQVHGGKYIFEGTKARAKHLELDNALGFTRHAREFIEIWVKLSALLTGNDENAWLFPYIKRNGVITNFDAITQYPHTSVNKLLSYLGLTQLTPSVLRQTKIDTLMKVTEDIYLVSIAANNSITTITKHYSTGLEQDHERNLSAAMEAKFNIAKGKSVIEAVTEAKYAFHDVLSEYDYRKLRKQNPHESITPLGVRCQDNTKGASSLIDKALKRSGVSMPEEEMLCTDFLNCFECENHKLVAEVDDIWLMLSFLDTLKEMKNYPMVNSIPKSKFHKLFLTIEGVLERFKEVSKENHQQALEQHKSAGHPLYSTLYSLNDLLEVFTLN